MADVMGNAGDLQIDEEEELESSSKIERITYFGTDFDVHGLVRRLNQGDILIPSFDPATDTEGHLSGFQRKFVWKRPQMDRFIESILLGFPVPDIFLVQQADRSLLVLDGQQRLTTLQHFYSGDFELSAVVDDFKGLKYEDLDDELRRSLDNFFIHATVIKYTDSPEGAEAIYSIFERLNAGGTSLHPHEIRVALHNGEFVGLLRTLNQNQDWRELYGPVNNRLKDQELILRFISLYYDFDNYERPLKSFLNRFLFSHKNLEDLDFDAINDLFSGTCHVIRESLGRRAFRISSSINSALTDAIMVGMARRVSRGGNIDSSLVAAHFDSLISNSDFLDSIGRATADEDRVRRRINLAADAFRDV